MTTQNWRKSSYSQPNGSCVELNRTLDTIRDSKDGTTLRLDRPAVTTLIRAVSSGS